MKKTAIISYMVELIIFGIGVILLNTVAAPCPEGMKCQNATLFGHLFILSLACITLFSMIYTARHKEIEKNTVLKCSNIISLVIMIVSTGIMTVIPMCKMPEMACNLKTRPCFIFIFCINIVIQTFVCYKLFFKTKEKEEKHPLTNRI